MFAIVAVLFAAAPAHAEESTDWGCHESWMDVGCYGLNAWSMSCEEILDRVLDANDEYLDALAAGDPLPINPGAAHAVAMRLEQCAGTGAYTCDEIVEMRSSAREMAESIPAKHEPADESFAGLVSDTRFEALQCLLEGEANPNIDGSAWVGHQD